jgi:hypothetical protein
MINRIIVKKDMLARRLILALIVLAALIIVVQAGSAAPGREIIKNIANFATSPKALLTSVPTGNPDQGSWQTITDEGLGFSLQIPLTWYELDLMKLRYFRGRCFAPIPGDNLVKPQFCIEMSPSVRPSSLNGFASNDLKTQQEFFNDLNVSKISEPKIKGSIRQEVMRKYQHRGNMAVEQVETISAEAEGLEPFYTVNIYINDPRKGLIRLAILAVDEQQYSQYEHTFQQISESFTLLK